MFRRKVAPAAAIAAAAIMSASAMADGEYILLLPNSEDVVTEIDESYKSDDYSSDQYTVLLYEAGEEVSFSVADDLSYYISDAYTESAMEDYSVSDDGKITFSMPEEDLCLIVTDGSASEEAVYTADEAGITVILNGNCTGTVTKISGGTENISEDGVYSTDEVFDLFTVTSSDGFSQKPDVSVWKDGVLMDNTDSVIVNMGGSGSNYVVDIKNSMDLDGSYVIQLTMPGSEMREVNSVQDETENDTADEPKEETETEEADAVDSTIRLILYDGLSADVLMSNGSTETLEANGDRTLEGQAEEIMVYSEEEGVPSKINADAYRNSMKVDIEELTDSEEEKEDGYALVMLPAESGSGYMLVISLADSAVFTERTETEFSDEETETEIETDTAEVETETETETVSDEAEADIVIIPIIENETSEDEAAETEEADTEEPEADETETSASGVTLTEEGGNGTVKEGGSFTFSVNIEDGFSATDDFAVKANGEILEPDENGYYTITDISEDQNITVEGIADTLGPEITLTINGEKTDGTLFAKSEAVVEISADDAASGVESLQYHISEDASETPENTGSWMDYSEPVTLYTQSDCRIFVKAVDSEGNESYLSSDELILYDDAEGTQDTISVTKGSGVNVSLPIELNGNTVKTVLIDGASVPFTSENGIEINAEAFDALTEGGHEVTVQISPMSVDYAGGNGDAPSDVSYTLTVEKEAGSVENVRAESKEYDGIPVSAPSYDTGNTGNVKVEYRSFGEDDGAWTENAPVQAGEYEVRITAEDDGTYAEAYGITEFSISAKKAGISVTDQEILYGDDMTDGTEAVEITGLADGDVLSSVTVSEEDGRLKATDPVILNADGDDVTGSYEITYSDGTLSVVPGNQDAPEGLSGSAETVLGKADGRIEGLDTSMEYGTDGVTYSPVTDSNEEFAAGTYYVRYAESEHLNASEPVEVSIDEGMPLTIVFMIDSDVAATMNAAYGDSIPESSLPSITLSNGVSPSDAHWDADLSDITSDMVVHAEYSIGEYSISLPSSVDGAVVTADIATDEEIEALTDGMDSYFAVRLDKGITGEVFFKDGSSELIGYDVPYITDGDVSSLILSCAEGFSELPEISVAMDGFLISDDTYHTELWQNGECVVVFDTDMTGDEYIFTAEF